MPVLAVVGAVLPLIGDALAGGEAVEVQLLAHGQLILMGDGGGVPASGGHQDHRLVGPLPLHVVGGVGGGHGEIAVFIKGHRLGAGLVGGQGLDGVAAADDGLAYAASHELESGRDLNGHLRACLDGPVAARYDELAAVGVEGQLHGLAPHHVECGVLAEGGVVKLGQLHGVGAAAGGGQAQGQIAAAEAGGGKIAEAVLAHGPRGDPAVGAQGDLQGGGAVHEAAAVALQRQRGALGQDDQLLIEGHAVGDGGKLVALAVPDGQRFVVAAGQHHQQARLLGEHQLVGAAGALVVHGQVGVAVAVEVIGGDSAGGLGGRGGLGQIVENGLGLIGVGHGGGAVGAEIHRVIQRAVQAVQAAVEGAVLAGVDGAVAAVVAAE